MKKILIVLYIILGAITIQAQSPQQFKYQAALRDTEGNIISNQEVTVVIDILNGSLNGSSVFTESHTVTTTANGLINLNIGSVENLDNINWGSNTYYIQITVNGSVMGTSQLLSVPYSLHSKTAERITGNINESDPVFTDWNKSSGIQITENQIINLQPYLTSIENQSIASLSDVDLTGIGHNFVLKYDVDLSKFVVAEASGTTETDPLFSSWDKTTGISITESQISDFGSYLSSESDPTFNNWDKSTGISITESQISDLGSYIASEDDPVFSAWDRTTGISIKESQISDFGSYLKSEADPVFGSWDKSTGISIKESQISDFGSYLTSETDPVFESSAASNITNSGSGSVISSAERTKLTNIEDGANVNVQANWNQTNTSEDDYIKNKPNTISDFVLNASSQKITNLADPENAQDAATKAYVDANSGSGSGVINGNTIGDLLYWNGSEWAIVPAGSNGETLTFSNGQPQWTSSSPGAAIVQTNSVSDTTCHTATISSEVVSEGGNAVNERGIVWGATPNLNVNDNEKIERGIGSGTYDATIMGLNESATYYARSYAINSAGVSYGDAVEIVTPSPGEGATSQLTDIDGNVYNSVYRNGKWWMTENLKTTKLNDNTEIQLVTNNSEWAGLETNSTPAYCWYGNNESNNETYGNIYNWYTVNTGKICPDGWHVPSKNEWTALEDFLYTNGFNYDGTTYENKIAKALAAEAENWNNNTFTHGAPGYDAYPEYQNKTGFGMLPGGYRNYNGGFSDRTRLARFWSSTVSGTEPDKAWYFYLWFTYVDSKQSTWYKHSGNYIRCVKD